jgi:hypothetical protein
MRKFACVILATSITSLAQADEISKASEVLHSSMYKCEPYLHFQKPWESYNYLTLTVCLGQGGKSITWLLTNNCADTVYWTGLAERRYNGSVYSNAKLGSPGPYVLPITFDIATGGIRTKIKPGETGLPPFNQFESIQSEPMKPLPIKSYSLSKPYATISIAFAGKTVNLNEVFVAVRAERVESLLSPIVLDPIRSVNEKNLTLYERSKKLRNIFRKLPNEPITNWYEWVQENLGLEPNPY